MISRREKVLWLLYAGILVILFLLSSTDLIIKEQERRVYRISVIVEDESDANYTNFRKGMEHAAVDFNADVSFQTLYDAHSHQQQMMRITREQQERADALIVVPADEEAFASEMSFGAIAVPVVVTNAQYSGARVSSVISVDYGEMGEQLGVQIALAHRETSPVFLLAGPEMNSASRHFADGAAHALEEAGFAVSVVEEEPLAECFSRLDESGRAILVAADQQLLEQAASLLSLSGPGSRAVEGLYGRGTTLSILNSVDRGLISGICVTDDFSMGYFSIRSAVEAIQGRKPEQNRGMESCYITKKDLYQPQFEKILYPIG